MQVSQMCPIERFDTVEFLDLAIEVAKEKHFPPPMEYDKNNGKLMFGHEDVDTMPGHKMVVYMWTDDKDNI